MSEEGEKKYGLSTLVAVGLGGVIVGNVFSKDDSEATDVGGADFAYTSELASDPIFADPNATAEDGETAAPVPLYRSEPARELQPEQTVLAPAIEPAPPQTVYWRNCSEARAAGAAPVYRGSPGYSRKLDRDGDGVGCE